MLCRILYDIVKNHNNSCNLILAPMLCVDVECRGSLLNLVDVTYPHSKICYLSVMGTVSNRLN